MPTHPAPQTKPHHRVQPTQLALSLLLAGGLLAGCASAPLDDANTTAAEDPAATHTSMTWWRDFQDPLLADLITHALQANANIASAQAALLQARAVRDVQLAATRPQLTVTGSAQRSTSDNTPASISFRSGLDASWELDVFGSRQSNVANREADLIAARASLRDVQLSMTAEVALAYIQLRGLQSQLGIAQTNLASQSETLQITQWRAQAGLVTSLEVEQAQTAVSQTAAQIPLLQSNLAKARHSLATLTGQRPQALDAQLQTPAAIPQVTGTLADVIPADSLRQRADVRAAEARITAAMAALNAADAARKPSFRLGGSVGLTALTLTGLSNGAALASQVLASISVPLLDGGAANAQVKVQEAVLQQTRAAYQNTLLTALKEVQDAVVAQHNDRTRLSHLQQAASAAHNAALLAQNRYSSGLVDFQTVLQTQRTLLSAQDSLASLQAELSNDHVRLVKAMGGGWL
ncbi:efflux transporter outer membrane subunit [Rhodoferax sp.]|uniref:efflux transporter outer membrane subunit n=1 Tax=Rhodoferax sp. TaxID=50421 RepID=UPI00260339EA|nr:efflux transporter outer membrane subunit [Rhodoferax sp.]MDD2809066.1 efflux transporter outer membrane subunit [Rhodoferax sp.]